MNKINLKYPIIVEGKYDKIKLSAIVSSPIVTLDGFSFFNSKDKQSLLRKYAEKGVIVLTDSDKAGGFIRSKLKCYIKGEIINLYTPLVKGKEKRKSSLSKEGLLGVEGIDEKTLFELLSPYESIAETTCYLTKSRLFADGLSGRDGSAELRQRLATELGLPPSLTSNAFIDAVNSMIPENRYVDALNIIKEKSQ